MILKLERSFKFRSKHVSHIEVMIIFQKVYWTYRYITSPSQPSNNAALSFCTVANNNFKQSQYYSVTIEDATAKLM